MLKPAPAFAQLFDLDDPETYRAAQDYALLLINQERERNGLPGLRDDPLAAQAALSHAQEMLRGGYLSHWNAAGHKPTRRFNLLGGYHALTENVYSQQSDNLQLRESMELMLRTLMESEGHRAAILDPHRTHVGIGFAASGRQLFAAQEFITRIGGEYECPLEAEAGAEVEFSGRFDPDRYSFSHVLVGWEERPRARDRGWLAKGRPYGESDTIIAACVADKNLSFAAVPVNQSVVVDSAGGRFICSVALDFDGLEGLYYLFLWLNDNRTGLRVMAATATVDVAN